jgi:hypothetical protein
MTAQLAIEFPAPTARLDDPDSSRAAAESVKGGNDALCQIIRAYVRHAAPVSHEEIADYVLKVYGDRWLRGTVVSACARAGLTECKHITAVNRRGKVVATWRVEESTVRTIDVL